MEKFFRKLDSVISPGKNFASEGYTVRARNLCKDIVFLRKPVRSLILFAPLIYMIIASYVLVPICILLKSLKFRFIDIDLIQIGSIIFLDLLLRENCLRQKSSRYQMFVLASKYQDSNRYILDLYSDRVIFIRNSLLKFLLGPFFVSSVFKNDSSHPYEPVYNTSTHSHFIWKKFREKFDKTLIKMPQQDLTSAKIRLSKYVNVERPFVALHARDNGFYQIKNQTTRNADIRNYKETIEFLVNFGFTVIRVGDPLMTDTTQWEEEYNFNYFDYARSSLKSELMDCYILSECAFMIGCTSGPNCIPPLFHKNCVSVNWYNPTNGPFLWREIYAPLSDIIINRMAKSFHLKQ